MVTSADELAAARARVAALEAVAAAEAEALRARAAAERDALATLDGADEKRGGARWGAAKR